MELTKEKIIKNAKKFFTTGQEYGFMPEKLMTFLGQDIVSAPCSTMTSLNNAFEGGLLAHTLLVTKIAVSINDTLPESLKVDKTSLVKVCCLHQIGKTFLYKPCTSEWHKTHQGKMYEYNEELVSMRVGERSAYYAFSCGVELTETEYASIVLYDKDNDDTQAKYFNSMLGDLLKIANTLAIKEENTIK